MPYRFPFCLKPEACDPPRGHYLLLATLNFYVLIPCSAYTPKLFRVACSIIICLDAGFLTSSSKRVLADSLTLSPDSSFNSTNNKEGLNVTCIDQDSV